VAGQVLTLTLQGSDPDGDPLTYAARAINQAYSLKRSLGLYTTGNYWTNWGGRHEKWIQGTGGLWYFITPDGGFYQWDGSHTASASLVARFSPADNADPTLLTNAPRYPATLALSGASLSIAPQSGFTGAFSVTATVGDGTATASRTFRVTVS
jgi:hypothetical protein